MTPEENTYRHGKALVNEQTYREMERRLGPEKARAMFWFPTLEQFVASFPEIFPAGPEGEKP